MAAAAAVVVIVVVVVCAYTHYINTTKAIVSNDDIHVMHSIVKKHIAGSSALFSKCVVLMSTTAVFMQRMAVALYS